MGDSSTSGVVHTNDRLLFWRRQSLAALRSWFPGVMVWFGEHTEHWWALLPGGLVEAGSPDELGRVLADSGMSVSSSSGWRVRGDAPLMETRPQPVVRVGELRWAPSGVGRVVAGSGVGGA